MKVTDGSLDDDIQKSIDDRRSKLLVRHWSANSITSEGTNPSEEVKVRSHKDELECIIVEANVVHVENDDFLISFVSEYSDAEQSGLRLSSSAANEEHDSLRPKDPPISNSTVIAISSLPQEETA